MGERTMLLADASPAGSGWRTSRRWLKWLLGLTCLLGVFIWLFAPSILELPVRQRLLAIAEESTGGVAQLAVVDLSWSGPQVIEGLRTSGPDCSIELDLDAAVHASLLSFVGHRMDPIPIVCSGVVKISSPSGPHSTEQALLQTQSSGSILDWSFGSMPPVQITLGPLAVEMPEPSGTVRTLSTDSLQADFSALSNGLRLQGAIIQAHGDKSGAFDIDLAVDRLLDAKGRLQPEVMTGHLDLAMARPSIPLPVLDRLQSLAVEASRAQVDGSAMANVTGEFTLDAGASSEFSVVIELSGQSTDSPGRLAVAAESFPAAALDSIDTENGLLQAILGDTFDCAITYEEQADADGSIWTLSMTAVEPLEIDLAVVTEGSEVWMTPGQSLMASVQLTPERIADLVWRLGPVLEDMQTVEDPITVRMSGLAFDRASPISSLDAVGVLEIGAVTLDVRSPVFSILEGLLGAARRYVPAVIEPIRYTIQDGVLHYAPFDIHFRRGSVKVAGSIDCNTGQLDMAMQLPVDAIGVSVKELRDISQVLGGEVLISGTLEEPVVQFVPVLRPERLLRTPGLGDLFESLGDGSHQPLLEGIGELLRRGDD